MKKLDHVMSNTKGRTVSRLIDVNMIIDETAHDNLVAIIVQFNATEAR